MEYFDQTTSWEVFTACKSEVLCYLERIFLYHSFFILILFSKKPIFTSRPAFDVFVTFSSWQRKEIKHPTMPGTEARLIDVIVTSMYSWHT